MSNHQVLEAKFDASADIVSRLGAELFTDSSQALLELVKNSYDADATTAELDISRSASGGQLVLADNGTGMSERVIRESWLRLSFSPKREQKRKSEKSKRGRTPLGDKGLGRLGAQLLGSSLQIRTRPQGEDVEHTVGFEFAEFSSGRTLAEVPVTWTSESAPFEATWPFRAKHGTILTISGLVDSDVWAEPLSLQRELGTMVNPFAGIDSFGLSARVDGEDLEVERLSQNVRDSAMQRWQVSYDGDALEWQGLVRLAWFQARDKRHNELLQAALRDDGGERLIEMLGERTSSISDFTLVKAKKPWLIKMTRRIEVGELANVPSSDPDCGPFELEIDVVARDFGAAKSASLSVFDTPAEYRQWLEQQGGIRVYRDGFVVASGYDLLRLGQGFTKAASYYSLRPSNVFGYVGITAEHNSGLEETTDREGFRETEAFRRFDHLLTVSRDQINRAMDEAGRTGAKLTKTLVKESEEAASPSPEDLAEEAASVSQAADAAQAKVSEASAGLESWMAKGPELSDDEQEAIDQAREALDGADGSLEDLKRLASAAQSVAGDFAELEENFEDLYQTIGLGLAAEGIAHEITHVVQRLGERAQLAQREIEADDANPNLAILIDEVDAAAKGLTGQLRHLDPQLRRARTKRRLVNLAEFVTELGAYHRQRLASADIEVRVKTRAPATVWLSPGRLAQVLDNLVLNSEYWVLREIEKNGGAGEITISASAAKVQVADSGPGVPAEMLDSIFRPYVSMKSEGRGLGLFVARQLLEIDGGTLSVRESPEGKSSIFVIDLAAARKEGPK